jgi:clan AA aspartic protease (TIGR02281 family)
MTRFLLFLLTLSISLNVFLFFIVNKNASLQLSEASHVHQAIKSDQQSPIASATPSPSEQRMASSTREDLRQTIFSLYQQQQWQRLGAHLTEYLADHPRDWPVLFIEGQYLIHTQTSAVGIAFLYQLLNQVDDVAMAKQIHEFIEVHTQSLIRALVFNQDWYALSLLLEPLIQVDPLHRGFIEHLAMSYAEQDLPNAMFNTLGAVTPEDVIYQRVVRRWQEQFGNTKDTQESEDTSADQNWLQPSIVSLIPFGNQWLSTMTLGGQEMTLLLDTGASTIAIGQNAFTNIASSDKRFLGRIVVNTANGQSQGELYRLRGASFGGWQFQEIDIVVLSQAELASDFDGLLGMNLLNRFAWQLDAVNGKLLLAKRQ